MPARPARCPQCGFSYAWQKGRCGHCPSPGRLWESWFGTTTFRGFWPMPADRRPSRLALLNFAAGCLRRVADHLADPAVRDFVRGWDAGPGGSSLPEFAAQAAGVLPSRTDRIRERATDPAVLAAIAAGGLAHLFVETGYLRWTAESVAQHCWQAVGAASFPARELAEAPLPAELERHRDAAIRAVERMSRNPRSRAPGRDVGRAVAELQRSVEALQDRRSAAERAEEATQCGLFRDVMPYPYQPVAFHPDWRTGSAVALARTLYESGDFAHMPILADALEDAGCTDPQVIGHCRDPDQPHVRGCWVVEAILTSAGN